MTYNVAPDGTHFFEHDRRHGIKKVATSERLIARVWNADKAVIMKAATLARQSVGSIVVTHALKVALEILETHNRVIFNAEQSRRFCGIVAGQAGGTDGSDA
ncbi:MAG: DUF1778 domain-containing protein [Opitutaceae bacterium]